MTSFHQSFIHEIPDHRTADEDDSRNEPDHCEIEKQSIKVQRNHRRLLSVFYHYIASAVNFLSFFFPIFANENDTLDLPQVIFCYNPLHQKKASATEKIISPKGQTLFRQLGPIFIEFLYSSIRQLPYPAEPL
ncbi:MAG: hypothetical protein K0Q48_557 [Bacillota bacterium]|nr:hypothetical protein [Bacillota bacterium]